MTFYVLYIENLITFITAKHILDHLRYSRFYEKGPSKITTHSCIGPSWMSGLVTHR